MAELKKLFPLLDYDITGLSTIIYTEIDPGTSDDCNGGSCDKSCSNGCTACYPGCNAGGR